MPCQKARLAETRARGQIVESVKRKRMRHPGIAPVHVVFDQQQHAARFQERSDMAQHLFLLPEKVQGIGHQDAIKRGQIYITGKICGDGMQVCNASKPGSVGLLQGIQPVSIPVYGVYVRAEAEQFSQS